jgi:polyhydroxyalkanoate synthase subunit PhaC
LNKTSPLNTTSGSEKENELRYLAHKFDDPAIHQALLDELNVRISQFIRGIKAYNKNPRRHRSPEPRVLKQIGAARLLDYGTKEEGQAQHPVSLIPSLINRAYVLDLTEDRSLVRHMATQGLRPLLVDWGHPSEAEQNFNLESYITGPLQVFFDIACQLSDTKPSVLGYCMGGLLALAIANNNSNKSASLSLLATPWDFHSGIGAHLLYLTTLRLSLAQPSSQVHNFSCVNTVSHL